MTPLLEPEIQDAMLDILPEDGPLALSIMAQLSANMLTSINGANVDDFIADLKSNLETYKAMDAKKAIN